MENPAQAPTPGPTQNEIKNNNQEVANILEAPLENDLQVINLMITFLNIAHKRGAFELGESSKIWNCIEYLKKK